MGSEDAETRGTTKKSRSNTLTLTCVLEEKVSELSQESMDVSSSVVEPWLSCIGLPCWETTPLETSLGCKLTTESM